MTLEALRVAAERACARRDVVTRMTMQPEPRAAAIRAAADALAAYDVARREVTR